MFLPARSCACACVRGSGPAPRRPKKRRTVFCTLTARFSDLSLLPPAYPIEIYGTCRIEPLLELTSRFKPLHFSTHLSATWKLIVARFRNNSIYIYIYKFQIYIYIYPRSNFPQSSVEPREGARLGRGCFHCEREDISVISPWGSVCGLRSEGRKEGRKRAISLGGKEGIAQGVLPRCVYKLDTVYMGGEARRATWRRWRLPLPSSIMRTMTNRGSKGRAASVASERASERLLALLPSWQSSLSLPFERAESRLLSTCPLRGIRSFSPSTFINI